MSHIQTSKEAPPPRGHQGNVVGPGSMVLPAVESVTPQLEAARSTARFVCLHTSNKEGANSQTFILMILT